MRVLAFTPTYADLLRPETVASVIAQKWAGRLTWEVGRWNPYPPPDVRNVAAQYVRARQTFLDGEYDALWLVEHDMTFGPHTLAKLLDTGAAVAYAPYLLRHGRPVLSAWRYENRRNLGMSLSLYPADLKAAQAAGVVRTCGVGFGCTLIRRPVLEAIAFHSDNDGQPPDLPFAVDCIRADIVALTHFGVPCGHWHEGEVLMADNKGSIIARVLANADVNVKDGDEQMALKAGRYYSLSLAAAAELARAGYVTITNDAVQESSAPTVETRKTAVDPVKAKRSKRATDKNG